MDRARTAGRAGIDRRRVFAAPVVAGQHDLIGVLLGHGGHERQQPSGAATGEGVPAGGALSEAAIEEALA